MTAARTPLLKEQYRRFMRSDWRWAMLIVIAIAIADLALPDRHLPWRALEPDEPVGLATGIKLSALTVLPTNWCDGVVDAAHSLQADRVAPVAGANGCGFIQAYNIAASDGISLAGRDQYPMSCPVATAAHIWLRELNKRAVRDLGQKIRRVHHAGTYSCRRMYNRPDGPFSEHAFANAWDVTGFELTDGRVVSVKSDWSGDHAKARFLHDARDIACKLFRVVLSPDHNAAHHDHFHLDMGMNLSCD